MLVLQVYAFIDDFVSADQIESPDLCEAILKKVLANVRRNKEHLKAWPKVHNLRKELIEMRQAAFLNEQKESRATAPHSPMPVQQDDPQPRNA